MKLIDYIRYLQYMHIKHGDADTEVNIKINYEYMGDNGFDYTEGYANAIPPYYDKKKNCIVVHEEHRSLSKGE